MKSYYDPAAYDARVVGPRGDVEFYLGLAREAHEAGLPVLELACGTGRVAIPIAQAGIETVGLDLSPAMLGRAREKSAGIDGVRWVEGNMRSFELPERFGLIFIAFRSFQHLLETADQISCMECIRAHLAPGGKLAINLFNPDILAIADWLSSRKGSIQRRRDAFQAPETGNTTHAYETRDYTTAGQQVDATLIDEEIDGAGVVVSRVYRELKLRYLHRFEMEHLLARTGFDIEALYGDFAGTPFGDTSPEMVWVARVRD